MTTQANNLELMAAWLRATPAPYRWRVLQTQISQVVATDAYCWTKRSFAICERRVPARVVSAPANAVC